jgi:hypothetical protein
MVVGRSFGLLGFPSLQEKIRNSFALAHQVPGDGFQNLEEADIQELINSHAATLTEGDLEQLQHSVNRKMKILLLLCKGLS